MFEMKSNENNSKNGSSANVSSTICGCVQMLNVDTKCQGLDSAQRAGVLMPVGKRNWDEFAATSRFP
jgi:hypothetical protein